MIMTTQELLAAVPFLALIVSLIAILANVRATEKNAKTAALVAQKHVENALAVQR